MMEGGYQKQVRAGIKAMRRGQWAFRIMGTAIVVFAAWFVVSSIIEWRVASESADWPSVEGRIVSSELRSRNAEGDNHESIMVYRPGIAYEYEVDGKSYRSERIRFSGWGDDTGIHSVKDKGAAEAVVKRYPVQETVLVHYNPRKPAQAVLEPGAAHIGYEALLGSAAFLIAAIAFTIGVPLLIGRGVRSWVGTMAELYGPHIWDTATELGLAPPAGVTVPASLPVRPRRPEVAHGSAKIDGRRVAFTFSDCLAHTAGDLSGNLDLTVRTEPALAEEAVVKNMRLKVPGYNESLDVLAWEKTSAGLELVFSLAYLPSCAEVEADDRERWFAETAAGLETVALGWQTAAGEIPLVSVPCTPVAAEQAQALKGSRGKSITTRI